MQRQLLSSIQDHAQTNPHKAVPCHPQCQQHCPGHTVHSIMNDIVYFLCCVTKPLREASHIFKPLRSNLFFTSPSLHLIPPTFPPMILALARTRSIKNKQKKTTLVCAVSLLGSMRLADGSYKQYLESPVFFQLKLSTQGCQKKLLQKMLINWSSSAMSPRMALLVNMAATAHLKIDIHIYIAIVNANVFC